MRLHREKHGEKLYGSGAGKQMLYARRIICDCGNGETFSGRMFTSVRIWDTGSCGEKAVKEPEEEEGVTGKTRTEKKHRFERLL
ncbi:hypothetical protein CesoFtcFv8_000668 [Champsocephalus esox]|uniref:Uncharacterized protein n=1 Tax=Champsocephalus esox TaxID=159716 RepID=A0AAN8HG46_9TELE|nr:hypothetical protein CesoFtcFv8_000668 [Champsocephalus esox]